MRFERAQHVFDRVYAAPQAREGGGTITRAFRSATVSLFCLLLATAPGRAQSLLPAPEAPTPSPVLVPPYEINKMVRAAGFTPLTPPRSEGPTYVLRATDDRGVLMRVVVDARSGEIRAVNRVVPARLTGGAGTTQPLHGGPGLYGSLPDPPPPYGGPALGSPPYGPTLGPPPHEAPPDRPMPAVIGGAPTVRGEPDLSAPPPPLPRPRPSRLTIQKAKTPGKAPKARAANANSPSTAVSVTAAPHPTPAASAKPPTATQN